jgi:hypothetical protein
MTEMTTKQRATLLLRKYDHMRKELREVERELSKVVAAYGREAGYWGLSKDMFRIQLDNEEAARLEDQADRHAWERQHG